MDCEQVNSLLSAFIDEALEVEQSHQVQSHLLNCSSCRQKEQELRSTIHWLARLPHYKAPSQVTSQILEQLPQMPSSSLPSGHPIWQRAWFWKAWLAACLLLGLGWYFCGLPLLVSFSLSEPQTTRYHKTCWGYGQTSNNTASTVAADEVSNTVVEDDAAGTVVENEGAAANSAAVANARDIAVRDMPQVPTSNRQRHHPKLVKAAMGKPCPPKLIKPAAAPRKGAGDALAACNDHTATRVDHVPQGLKWRQSAARRCTKKVGRANSYAAAPPHSGSSHPPQVSASKQPTLAEPGNRSSAPVRELKEKVSGGCASKQIKYRKRQTSASCQSSKFPATTSSCNKEVGPKPGAQQIVERATRSWDLIIYDQQPYRRLKSLQQRFAQTPGVRQRVQSVGAGFQLELWLPQAVDPHALLGLPHAQNTRPPVPSRALNFKQPPSKDASLSSKAPAPKSSSPQTVRYIRIFVQPVMVPKLKAPAQAK